MKLKNKKTGEIVKVNNLNAFVHTDEETKIYNSLAELLEEWEDYEEPKGYWYIRDGGNIDYSPKEFSITERHKEIGNKFETKEEAEKAVKKLMALTRLESKGFRFNGEEVFSEGLLEIDGVLPALKGADTKERLKMLDDLNICFGGEE